MTTAGRGGSLRARSGRGQPASSESERARERKVGRTGDAKVDLLALAPLVPRRVGLALLEEVEPGVVRQDLLALDVVHDDVWHAEHGPLVGEVHAREGPQVQRAGRVRLVHDLLEVRVAGEEVRLERRGRFGRGGRVGRFVGGRHGRAVIPPAGRASERVSARVRGGGRKGGGSGTRSMASQGLLRVLASYACSVWSTET